MFRTVIVPLNGSAPAEAAVPYAAEQATRDGATLVLVRVLARPELAPGLPRRGGPAPRVPACPADEVATERRQAFAYLDGVVRRFRLPADCEAVVTTGDPILRLVAEIQRRPAPLVVVAGPAVDRPKTLAPDELVRHLLLARVAPVLTVQERAADLGVKAGPWHAGVNGSAPASRSVRTAPPAALMAAAAISSQGQPTAATAPAISDGIVQLDPGGV
jgi:nucleotide-binding universal stress UspA family protein